MEITAIEIPLNNWWTSRKSAFFFFFFSAHITEHFTGSIILIAVRCNKPPEAPLCVGTARNYTFHKFQPPRSYQNESSEDGKPEEKKS